MSSDVDICNLALSHLGDEANVVAIAPPDGTQAASYCGTYYPIARDALLGMHPWSFATKRTALAAITNPSPDDWQYAYALPSTCLRPLSSLYPGVPATAFGTDAGGHPYIVEADADGAPVLYTNVETPVLRYIDRVVDPARFSPLFVVALARLLSSYLAGPVIKGAAGMQVAKAEWQLFTVEFSKAATADANIGKRTDYETRIPSFLAGRGGNRWPFPGDWRNR